jgi:hypothetical protein
MFDVVKMTVVNGKTILYCINDKIEKSLIDKYNSITKHNSSAGKKAKNGIENSFTLFVYQEKNYKDQFFTVLLNNFYFSHPHLPDSVSDNISPPPKPGNFS